MSGKVVELFVNAVCTWFEKTPTFTSVFAQLKVSTSRSRVEGAMAPGFVEPLTLCRSS